MELVKQSTGSKPMAIFSSSTIQTKGHWAVGTQWQYSKGVVTMYDEGFHCDCKKNPRQPCNHIRNVKLRLYGTFDEHYQAA
jgi:hypothetical protein